MFITTAFETLKRGTNPNINPDALPEFLDRLEHSDLNLITKYLIQWQLLTLTATALDAFYFIR